MIYYINEYNGQCYLMEINPIMDQLRYHNKIYEFKSHFCQGLEKIDNTFLFMGNNKTVKML